MHLQCPHCSCWTQTFTHSPLDWRCGLDRPPSQGHAHCLFSLFFWGRNLMTSLVLGVCLEVLSSVFVSVCPPRPQHQADTIGWGLRLWRATHRRATAVCLSIYLASSASSVTHTWQSVSIWFGFAESSSSWQWYCCHCLLELKVKYVVKNKLVVI